VDSAEAALALLRQPGLPLRHLQLRCKAPPTGADAAWHAALAETIRRCLPVAEAAGVTLWVNDHWETALAAGARALHLGQEDWAGLSPAQRRRLQQARAREGVALGLSSHSVWELARAAGLRPSYIACGPVWPTTTKAMPWRPQGLDNLAWWAALSPAPVVAIGGVLQPDQARAAAAAGATRCAWCAAWPAPRRRHCKPGSRLGRTADSPARTVPPRGPGLAASQPGPDALSRDGARPWVSVPVR
jgi:hydroxymethylpyrimidine kinase/phosphomethylpyrimidine kinase/thiamine-phosphate diphosphorylase